MILNQFIIWWRLKELINEVLDERELQKKLNGPYDVPEYTYRLDELQE